MRSPPRLPVRDVQLRGHRCLCRQKVRQALCYDTNRQAVVDSIVHGYGDAAYTPLLQLNEFRTDDVERYDYDGTGRSPAGRGGLDRQRRRRYPGPGREEAELLP